MVLYILTNVRVLSIVYLDQLSGARHTHISYQDKNIASIVVPLKLIVKVGIVV